MTLDYFYGQAGELFSFFRIPKALFQEQRFQSLSTDARTLYGILLDRMSLSVKNGWLDEQGRVYIILRLSGKRFEPSIRKKRKILIPTWVYSCCVRHEKNRSESCRIVFPHMDVNRMGYGYCNIIYGQIRQKSLIFFVYL